MIAGFFGEPFQTASGGGGGGGGGGRERAWDGLKNKILSELFSCG